MVGGRIEKSANGRATFPIEEFSILLMCHFGRFPFYMTESAAIGIKANFKSPSPPGFSLSFAASFLYKVQLINI